MITPANERTTIIYEDGTMTLVEQPRGGRTTVLYDAARNIAQLKRGH